MHTHFGKVQNIIFGHHDMLTYINCSARPEMSTCQGQKRLTQPYNFGLEWLTEKYKKTYISFAPYLMGGEGGGGGGGGSPCVWRCRPVVLSFM